MSLDFHRVLRNFRGKAELLGNGMRPPWFGVSFCDFSHFQVASVWTIFDVGGYDHMRKLRTTAVFVAALLVTVSVSVVASANISPPSLNAPSRNQGAGLNNIGAQNPIFGGEYISGGDDVCLPRIPNAPRRRDKAPKQD